MSELQLPFPVEMHTNEPWELYNTDDYENSLELRGDSDSRHIAYISQMSEPDVTDFETEELCKNDRAEHAANARLIKEAPRMYQLIKQYLLATSDLKKADAHKEAWKILEELSKIELEDEMPF